MTKLQKIEYATIIKAARTMSDIRKMALEEAKTAKGEERKELLKRVILLEDEQRSLIKQAEDYKKFIGA